MKFHLRAAWNALGEQQRRLVTYAWVVAYPVIAGAASRGAPFAAR